MQVTVENVSTVKKIMHIEVPVEDVAKEFDKAYNEIKKTAKIRGFRPGKAPRKVLEGMFKKDVHNDVTSKLIQTSFIDALKETEIEMIGDPKLDPPEINPTEAFKYDATVEIKPAIEDIDFKGLKLEKTVYAAAEDEIDGQLQMLRKNFSKKEPLTESRPVIVDDYVQICYEGFIDGNPFDKTPFAENFTMQIGGAAIAKEIDDGMIGMNAGDTKDIEVEYPEDFLNNELAGKRISYKVKLVEIRQEILPEIDDAFAKSLGQFEDLEALKKEILANLNQGYEKRTEQELNEQIFSALIEKSDFEVPDLMVQYELDAIITEAEKAFDASNMTLEQVGQTKELLATQYRPVAEKQVRRHLILDKIVLQEKMTLSDEAVEEGFVTMAETFKQPMEMIKTFYEQSPEKLELFKHTLLEKNAVALIIENSDVTEVEPKNQDDEDKDAAEDKK